MSRPDSNQKSESVPPDSASPPELASGWILQSFQQVNSRIDRVDSRLDHVDSRLRRVENILWVATGCVIIMTAIVGYVATLVRDFLMLWMQQ